MARTLYIALALLMLTPTLALAVTSSADPTNQGYVTTKGEDGYNAFPPTQWEKYKSECKKCQPLVDSYNAAMQELFNARAALAQIKDAEESLNRLSAEDSKDFFESLVGYNEKGLGDKENFVAVMVDMGENLTEMIKQKQPMEELIANLEYSTTDLRTQIGICEEQCNLIGDENYIIGSLGTPPEDRSPALPFDWHGPYLAACEKCEALALRLNQLPALILQNMADIDASTAKIATLKVELQKIKTRGIYVHDDARTNARKKKDLKRLDELEREISETQAWLKRLQNDYEAIRKNFNETLKSYDECNKSCGGEKEPIKEQACVFPDEYPAITIGPNDQYGSGAAMTNEIKDKAKGMAMGALGGALGGGGFSLGGGGRNDSIGSPGGDSSQKGPKTDKDPTKGDFTMVSAGDTDLEIRTGWDDGNFIVSTNIDDSPGDGTFHAQWIEGADGKRYLPIRYLIIALYRDWKLSVWWDYKRWQDGELVEHKSGDSMTVGRDHLGTWTLFEGAKGVANSIWNALGFATAKKGVQNLGAVFDLPAAAISGPCPARLITHISLPSEDPVLTMPVVGELFRSQPEDEKNLSVLVRPAIVSGPE